MVLYHGSIITVEHPKIIRNEIGRDFDIVIGKIANDNVGETVSYVVQGIMRKEDAVKRLAFEKINNQIAFCTENSLEYLRFIESFEGEM